MKKTCLQLIFISILVIGGILIANNKIVVYGAQNTFQTSLSIVPDDNFPPTIPSGFAVTPISISQINLAWDASTDDVAVTGYRIFRDGNIIASTTSLFYQDAGLNSSTTYAYNVEAFDSVPRYSGLSTTESTTTFAYIPPVETPATGSATSGSLNLNILNLTVDTTSIPKSAIIRFSTNMAAQGKIHWGTSLDYELGSIASSVYKFDHEIKIDDIDLDTLYFFKIEATTSFGRTKTLESSFVGESVEGLLSLNPINFKATANDDEPSISLDWNNPQTLNFDSVRVIRSDKFFPKDINDGQIIYEGSDESFVDEDVLEGVTYYYAIFAKDTEGNYSSGALTNARIRVAGEISTGSAADTSNPLKDIAIIQNVDKKIKELSILDFDFIQSSRKIENVDQYVVIDGTKNLTISLAYSKIPEILKTIAITLVDPEDSTKVFSFLLRVNKDKTAYEATIAPLGRSGKYGMNILILDYKNQGLKRIEGSLQAFVFAGAEKFVLNNKIKADGFLPLLLALALILIIYIIKIHNIRFKKGFAIFIIALTFLTVGFSVLLPQTSYAAINKEINYQGKLTNSSNAAVADGLYNMEFKLYTALTGGTTLWTETLTTTNRVQVTNGLFSVMLGSTTPFTGVDFNQTLYLGVNIESDGEMSPRKIIGAVPAAFVSDTLDNISSEQFLRSDTQNATSSSSTFLNVLQSGAGKVAEFFGSASQTVLSILSNGNVGVGTSTPYAKLAVVGQAVAEYFTATSTVATSTFPVLDVSVRAKFGEVIIEHQDGSQSMYRATTSTNYARGTALQNAKAAATSGETIVVGPGTYQTTNLAKNGVNYYFQAGAIVLHSLGTSVSIWDDSSSGSNGPVTFIVDGQGEFLVTVGNDSVVKMTNASSNIVIKAKKISAGQEPIFTSAGNLKLSASESIISTAYDGMVIAGGTVYVNTPLIDASSDGIAVEGAGAVLYVDTQHVRGGSAGVNTEASSGTLYLNASHIESIDGESISNNQAVFNINAQFVDGPIISGGVGTTTIIGATIDGNITASAGKIILKGIDTTNSILLQSGSGQIIVIDGRGSGTNGIFSTVGDITYTDITVQQFLQSVGALNLLSGGTNQNITLTPSGTGNTIFSTGNLGIGTTSPYAKLSVVGQVVGQYFTATSTTLVNTFPLLTSTTASTTNLAITGITSSLLKTNSLGQVGAAIAGTDYSNFAYPFPSNATSTALAFTGGIDVLLNEAHFYNSNSDTVLKLSSNRRIGFGTSTPSVNFDFYSSDDTGDNTVFRIDGTKPLGVFSGTGKKGGNIDIVSPSGGVSLLGTGGNGGDVILNGGAAGTGPTSGSAGNIILSNLQGNVGVGTTSPFAKLSVAGNTYIGGNLTATGTLTVGSLTGPLQAINGLVSASSTLSTFYGGTGISTAPSYGQLLLGNALGGYTLTATSSLGLANFAYPFPSNATSTLLSFNGGLTSYASTTIGAGGQTTGLTISGGATTTGNLYVAGNLGIGTTSPQNKLHVYSTVSADGLSVDGTTFPAITLRANGVVRGYAPFVTTAAGGFFSGSLEGDMGFRSESNRILFGVGSGVSTMQVSTASVGITGNLLPTGSVGIRTTNPQTALQINSQSLVSTTTPLAVSLGGTYGANAVGKNLKLKLFDINDTTSNYGFGVSASLLEMTTSTGGDFGFFTDAATTPVELMRLKSTGNLGIGTSSPYAKLSVVGQTVAEYFTATSTTRSSIFTNASTTNLTIGGRLYDSTSSAGTNGMILQTTGSASRWVATSSLGLANFAYPFPSNATSTLLSFNGGLTSYASTTIGAGGQTTGLTISGGATTTGRLVVQQASAGGVGVLNNRIVAKTTAANESIGIGFTEVGALNYPRITFDASTLAGVNINSGFVNRLDNVDQFFFGMSNEGTYGGTAGTSGGRFMGYYDYVASAWRYGFNGSGELYLGANNSSYGMKLSPSGSSAIMGGNLGIGDATPAALLTVGNGDLFQVNSSGAIAASTGITTSGGYTQSGTSANTFTGLTTLGNASTTQIGSTGTSYFATSGGKVGIGTTSPINTLSVQSATDATVAVAYTGGRYLQLTAGTAGTAFSFDTAGYFSVYGSTSLTDSGASSRIFQKVFGNGNTLFGNNSYLTADTNYKLNVNTAGSSGYFAVSSSATGDILNVNSSGNLGLGTTTPYAKLSVAGSSHLGGNLVATGTVALSGLSLSTTGNYLCIDTTTNLITSGTTCTLSSTRFKHDVKELDLGLETVLALKPVSFVFNQGYGDNGSTDQLGFVAEQADAIDPRLVPHDALGRASGFNYQNYTAVLTKAIQEQQLQIDLLKNATTSNSLATSSIATSTASILEESSGFISNIAEKVRNIISTGSEWIVVKIKATLAVFDRAEVKTIAVSEGIEMKDQVTGEIYCMTIRSGNFDKKLGSCSVEAPISIPTPTPTPTTNTEIAPITPPVVSTTEPVASSTDPVASSTPPVIVDETPVSNTADNPTPEPTVNADIVPVPETPESAPEPVAVPAPEVTVETPPLTLAE